MANENLTKLSHLEMMGERVNEEMEKLDDKNADVPVRLDLILAAASWVLSDDGAVYVYTYPVTGITPNHRADAILDDASSWRAARFGVHPTTETVTGGVVFKSRTPPASDLTGQLYISESVAYAASGTNSDRTEES